MSKRILILVTYRQQLFLHFFRLSFRATSRS